MKWDTIQANWTELKGRVVEFWGRITEDDLSIIQGKRDQLIALLRRYYGLSQDEAEHEVCKFQKQCDVELI
ncbi:MAG: CsbD family protein [Pirellulales bacterium]|nr:CsbD family protein [Pirellulales bacterium]